jgi:replicative DNA helicase
MALGMRTLGELALEVLDAGERAVRRDAGPTRRVRSGLTALDDLIPECEPFPIFITGAPSSGKTALALHFALTTASSGTPVTIYALDVASRLLAARLVGAAAGLDWRSVSQGRLAPGDRAALDPVAETFASLPVRFVDAPFATAEVIAATERAAEAEGFRSGLTIVDGLRRVDPDAFGSLVRLSMDLERTVIATARHPRRSRREVEALNLPLPDHAFVLHLERAELKPFATEGFRRLDLHVGQQWDALHDIPLRLVAATSLIEEA